MVLSRLALVSTLSLLSVSFGLTPSEPPQVSEQAQTLQGVTLAEVEAAQTVGGEFTLTECVFGGLGASIGALHGGAIVLAVGGPAAWGAGLIVAGVLVGGALAAC